MINYPKDFKNTNDRVKVDIESINSYVNSLIREMRETGKENYTIQTGNLFIHIAKLHEFDGGGYHTVVTENFSECYVDNKYGY